MGEREAQVQTRGPLRSCQGSRQFQKAAKEMKALSIEKILEALRILAGKGDVSTKVNEITARYRKLSNILVEKYPSSFL